MILSEARVLLVDDEPEIREIFAKWLVRSGCPRVTTAADGLDALSALEAGSYDLIVTDVHMPKMDGTTLVRSLISLGRAIPSIIFISGFADLDMREMYGLGVESFLPKPIHPAELLSAIKRNLAARSELWAVPLEAAPKQSIEIEDASFAEGAGKVLVSLGRGGFSVSNAGTIGLGKTSFRCRFIEEEREMSGQGTVRWRSKTGDAVGVEFAYLHENCRPWLIEMIEARCQGYIPAG